MGALMKQDKKSSAQSELKGTLPYYNNHSKINFSEYVTNLVILIGKSIFLFRSSCSSTNVSILYACKEV